MSPHRIENAMTTPLQSNGRSAAHQTGHRGEVRSSTFGPRHFVTISRLDHIAVAHRSAMPQNSPVHEEPAARSPQPVGPRPVPELGSSEAVTPPPVPVPVTDTERQDYGRLLDRAFERGLVGQFDYEIRLRELSEATSIEELARIVTELPAFEVPASPARVGRSSIRDRSTRSRIGAEGRSNPWVKLIVVVAIVVVAFVVLTLYAQHLVHSRPTGPPPAVVAVAPTGAWPALGPSAPRP